MKTIMIDDETYNKLKKLKGNRSFSKLLNHLAGESAGREKVAIRKFYGILTEEEAETWESMAKESRGRFRERL